MPVWLSSATDLLWRNAMTIIPLALVAWAICRWVPCRPATRHSLWLCVLASLIVGPLLPPLSGSDSSPATTATPERLADVTTLDNTSASADSRTPTPPRTKAHAEQPVLSYLRHATGSAGPSSDLGIERSLEAEPIRAATVRERSACFAERTPELGTPRLPLHSPQDQRSPEGSTDRSLTVAALVVADREPVSAEPFVASAPRGRRGNGTTLLTLDEIREADLTPVDNTATQTWPWHQARADKPPVAPPASAKNTTLADKPPVAPRVALMAVDEGLPQRGILVPTEPWTALPAPRLSDVDSPFSTPSVLAPARETIEPWVAGLLAIRDAIGNLPKVPSIIWIAGVLLVIVLRVRQTMRFRRLVHAGTIAPASIQRMVEETATAIGLRHAPKTIMVRDRISPMVWCGRELRLVLPRSLWSELDDIGRRAVLSHELAHIRRRDHWVCWIESIFGALYWWHPLIWWVRNHLKEEAENCCDAWVTWLLPRNRRTYAEVLLQTQQFVGEIPHHAPTGTIGALTGRTKRFARRLTMVMTKREAPNLSVTGVALAFTLVVIGWIATPAQSQEAVTTTAKESNVTTTVTVTETTDAATGHHATASECAVTTTGKEGGRGLASGRTVGGRGHSAVTVARDGTTPPHRAPAGRRPARSFDEFEERMARFEERFKALERVIARLSEQTNNHQPLAMPEMPAVVEMPVMPDVPYAALGTACGGTTGPCAELVRHYDLPEAVRGPLTELMIREDVPIRVRPTEEGLKVRGTAEQQAIFASFVQIITKKCHKKTKYVLPKGKLDAITKLMVHKKVPIIVTPRKDSIIVQGEPGVQAVFKAFVDMINPPKDTKAAGGCSTATEAPAHSVTRDYARANERARIAKEHAQFAREMKRVQAASLRDTHRQIAQLERNAAQLERNAERLENKADQLFDKADTLREKAEQQRNAEKAQHYEAAADEMEHQAEAMMAEARALFEQAEALEGEAEALELQVEQIEQEIEDAMSAAMDNDAYADHDEGEEIDFDDEI